MTAPETVMPLLPAGTEALESFVEAGVLGEADVQVAGAVARTVPGTTDDVLLATALCVRALRLGHVCVVLDRVAATVAADAPTPDPTADQDEFHAEQAIADLPWPDPVAWAEALRSSGAVTERDPTTGDPIGAVDPGVLRPLVFDGERVYLERYWRYERQVGDLLISRAQGTPGDDTHANEAVLDAALDRFFGPEDEGETDRQRRAARMALTQPLTVLAGGPGTGKTHTVARLLAAVDQIALDDDLPLEVALAAPTGKAAARMTEAVHQAVADADVPPEPAALLLATEASTIHRLLGYRDGITFRHDRSNPLPHDVVVVDETSMVALPLMARLLDALRPAARLVLVGDPFQLASVEAGAVLGDLVGPASGAAESAVGALERNIAVLQRVHRFAADSAIAALADAVRVGDADRAIDLLRDPGAAEVRWLEPDDRSARRELRDAVITKAVESVEAALTGDAVGALVATGETKVLCGTRFGPNGAFAWQDHVERVLPRLIEGLHTARRFYVGRPLIITRNDYITGVFNGDTGVVVDEDGRRVVVLAGPEGVRTLLPSQLDAVDTWWAMTIHKSQGSEFDHAVISLPHAASRILTRELLYTAVTRGREQVTVLADEAALRTAIGNPVARASGLQARLWS
jgi:exodeoxyribonuclease V alpha subunit